MEVCSAAPGTAGTGGRPAGRGPRGAGRGGRPRAELGAEGLLPVTFGAACARLPAPRSADPSGAGAQAHVWFCFPEGEGAPWGGRWFFCFSSTRRENEAETVWEVSEGRGRGMRRRGRDPRRADVSGVLEERLLRARGAARERLWEQQRLGDGGRAAAGLLHRPAAHSALGPGPPRSIAPRHWCSPEWRARRSDQWEAEGGRRGGISVPFFFLFFFPPPVFLIKWADEQEGSGGAVPAPRPGLGRALQAAAGRWAGPPPGRVFVRPGPPRGAGMARGRDWPEASCSVITRVTVCLFCRLRRGFTSLGGDTEWVRTIRLRTLEILMSINVSKTRLWRGD